jgi:hypothetical protein
MVTIGLLIAAVGLLVPLKSSNDLSRGVDVASVVSCIEDGAKMEQIALIEYGPTSWWNVICQAGWAASDCGIPNIVSNVAYNFNPTGNIYDMVCYGLAWNVIGQNRHTVLVFQQPEQLSFAEGGGYTQLCMPPVIKIAPLDVARIQAALFNMANLDISDTRPWAYHQLN